MISTGPTTIMATSGEGAVRRGGFKLSRNTAVLAVLLTLAWFVHLLEAFDVGYAVLPLFLAVIVGFGFQSPPVVGSFLLFGWFLLSDMDVPPIAGFPRIPATSLVAVVLLGTLVVYQVSSGRIRRLLRPGVSLYVGLFTLIFLLGYLGIFLHGKWDSVLVRTLAWQKLISCGSMFACGLLCCRNREDLRLALRLIPWWFILYLLCIPLGVYREFAANLLTSDSSYSVGLASGTLNSNTLGQGACLAAIVSAVLFIWPTAGARRRLVYGALFLLASGFTLATASRQSLLALLVGLALVLARMRPIVGVLLLILSLSVGTGLMQRMGDATSGQAFFARFTDIGKSSDEWSTASYSDRQREIELALPHLADRPLIGYGFGGYSLAKDIPDVRSRSDFNESDFLIYLWNDGYFLVGEHNFPLALYLQTGLVGMTAFLVLVLGPYFRLRRHNRLLPAEDRRAGYVDDVVVMALLAVIFVLQNISGGFALGSMGMLFFVVGAMVAGVDAPRRGRRRPALGHSPLRVSGTPQLS